MSDPPDQSSPRDEHETRSSLAPTGQRSPVILITTSAVGMQGHIKRDPPEPSCSLRKHETASSSVPVGQLSPVVLITTPTTPQTLAPGTQPPTEAADPGSQDFTPSQTSPPPSDPTLTFPIMKLPPELRLMAFDQLFLDLTIRRQHSMKYRNDESLLRKHQANDFRPYTNLLLTCKELSQEAKKLWDEQYLRECCFYSWHVSKLYDLAMVFDKMGKPYTEIKYVLRSHWEADFVSQFCLASTVATVAELEVADLMICQPGVSPGCPRVLQEQLYDRIRDLQYSTGSYIKVDVGIYEVTEDHPVRVVVERDEAGKTLARSDHVGPESCVISAHQNDTPLEGGGTRRSRYAQMEGKFSGIFWGGYDAAIGYGKFKLWEAVPPCPGLDHCHCSQWHEPENRFDCSEMIIHDLHERNALLQRWYDEIVDDQKWLNLGGKPRHSSEALMDDYGMAHWFDFEYWGEQAYEYWASWQLDSDDDTEGVNTQGEDTQDEGIEDEENEGETQGECGEDSGGDEREGEPLEWYSPSR
jgi:hypothetical protein